MISHLVWKTCSWFLAVGSLPCLHGELACTRTHIKHVGFNVCFCFVWRTKQSGSFRQKKNCTLQGHCTSWITFRSWFVPYILPCLELIIVNVAIFDDTSLAADRWDHIGSQALIQYSHGNHPWRLGNKPMECFKSSEDNWLLNWSTCVTCMEAEGETWTSDSVLLGQWLPNCFRTSFPWHIGHRLWVG